MFLLSLEILAAYLTSVPASWALFINSKFPVFGLNSLLISKSEGKGSVKSMHRGEQKAM